MFSKWFSKESQAVASSAPLPDDSLPNGGGPTDLPGLDESADHDLQHIFWAEYLSDTQKLAVKALRDRLEAEKRIHPLLSTDTDLTRFLKARKFNVDAAYKMCTSKGYMRNVFIFEREFVLETNFFKILLVHFLRHFFLFHRYGLGDLAEGGGRRYDS